MDRLLYSNGQYVISGITEQGHLYYFGLDGDYYWTLHINDAVIFNSVEVARIYIENAKSLSTIVHTGTIVKMEICAIKFQPLESIEI